MELEFLGTGAGMPSKGRNVSAIALKLFDERGTWWLFDCGEGTQHQLLHSPLKTSRLEFIFITHLHGDHVYGLPGLLTSRSNQGGVTPLTLFGPPGLAEMMEPLLRLSQARLTYELIIKEVAEGTVFEDETFKVACGMLDHRIDSYGYRIIEKDKPGKLDKAKLVALGIAAGPIYGRIKNGETVKLPDGRLIDGKQFVGPPIRGKVVTILGDTRKCESAKTLARGADLLVHESTFDDSRRDLAESYFHSTAREAAETAKEAGAKKLILTHISSRYQDEELDRLLREAREKFSNTYVASDFWSCPVK